LNLRSILVLSVGMLLLGGCASESTESQVEAPGLPQELADGAARLRDAALASDEAYATLAELCDLHGHRLSGSDRLENAIDWIADRMRGYGLQNVRKEEVLVPVWIRGEESLRLIEPASHHIAMLGLGGSVGTPPGGIRAEVLRVTSFDDLTALDPTAARGKIVLFDVPYTGYGSTVQYRSRGASAAAERGAVAALVRSVGLDGMRTPHTGALRYDEAVPRIPGAAIAFEDANLMARSLERGDRVVAELAMGASSAPDRISHNVLAEVVGREKPEEIVVIGGHIDSWDVGQGAQDDGVGCILAVEAARLMHALDLHPRRTVRVVLWTNEENGLRGGRAYRDLHAAELDQHVAAIESDSGNGRAQGFRFDLRPAAVDAEEVTPELEAARIRGLEKLRELLVTLSPVGADSVFVAGSGADISPIADEGVPALGVHHDTSEYFRIHHTRADTFDRIDPADLRANVAAMAVLAWSLAEFEGSLRP
jgi:carboxypeptidase Q